MFPIENRKNTRITQKISDILWATLGNCWKRIFKRASWFVSIILNFNAPYDAYTVERQCYSKVI